MPYDHPSLEPVLRDTLGTIIFQDQVIEVAMAFAGFSPGEAEGLRRAMSRKRSAAAIEAYHQRFVEGAARTHGADAETAERVYSMIVGFSGFGFPKAHGAAFGLLAYQSTWLRVHYGPEFLCALLNEQPMGFYAPDTLAHEAQRKGIELIAPDVNLSGEECTVDEDGRIRLGLSFVLGARSAELAALVAAREAAGPFRSLSDLASRAGAGRAVLDRLAWAGACDSLAAAEGGTRARRTALWRLGVAAPGAAVKEGTQLALPLDLPGAPALDPLAAWDSMVADYATTGLTLGPHPVALLRPDMPAGAVSTRDLESLAHEKPVTIGGLVVARQRPGTAKGIVFILLEDEFGTVNLIVPPPVYERHRLIVRSEPLLLAIGQAGEAADRGRRDQRLRARAAGARRAGRRRRRRRAAARPRRAGRSARGGARAGRRRSRRRGARRRRAGRLPRRRAGRAELRRGAAPMIARAAAPQPRRPAAQMDKVRLRWRYWRSCSSSSCWAWACSSSR